MVPMVPLLLLVLGQPIRNYVCSSDIRRCTICEAGRRQCCFGFIESTKHCNACGLTYCPAIELSEMPETPQPTPGPTHVATIAPTPIPTLVPTHVPSVPPTVAPSAAPSNRPTHFSGAPSKAPTTAPACARCLPGQGGSCRSSKPVTPSGRYLCTAEIGKLGRCPTEFVYCTGDTAKKTAKVNHAKSKQLHHRIGVAESTSKALKTRYLQFSPTQLRNEKTAKAIQISEFRFLDSHGASIEVAKVTNPGGSNPAGHSPRMLVDGKLDTKWVDSNIGSLIFDFGKPIPLDGTYTFATGNNDAERDPVRWTLEAWGKKGWTVVDDHSRSTVHVPPQRERFIVQIPLGVAAKFETVLSAHAICSYRCSAQMCTSASQEARPYIYKLRVYIKSPALLTSTPSSLSPLDPALAATTATAPAVAPSTEHAQQRGQGLGLGPRPAPLSPTNAGGAPSPSSSPHGSARCLVVRVNT